MTFLAPMAGVMAACIATPILLLFYFLKLRRRPLRVSSTLLWERAVRDLQVNAPFRWLRWSFLLLLQLLALAAFCMAIARPAIDAATPPAARWIILIDASASMSARDGEAEMTRLDEAKAQANELVVRLDESLSTSGKVEAAVISFAAAPRAWTSFTSSRGELRRAIDQIQPTDQPADLNAALKLAQALVMQSRGEDVSTRVVLLSDGAFDDTDSTSLGGAEFQFQRVGPAPEDVRDNLGVVALAARRDLDDPALVRIFARIANASTERISAPVTLRVDDEPVDSRDVIIPGRTEEGAGEAALTFEFPDAPTGRAKLATVSIGRADALPNDDIAAVRLDPAIPPRVMIVVPNQMDAAQELAHELLTQAIAAIGSRIIDTMNVTAYEHMATTPAAAERYDLLIFNGASVSWLPPIPSISFGGRLISNVERNGSSPPDSAAPEPARFASWRRSHPILRQVSLDSVVVARRGRHMTPIDPADTDAVEELAYGERGALILLIHDDGVDRLSVGFELAQSNWPVNVSFVVFLTNAVEQLTRMIGETTGVAFTTTDVIRVTPQAGAAKVTAVGPLTVTQPVESDDRMVSLGVLPLAGVYRVGGGAEADSLIPVNLLNARESAIETRDSVRVAGRAAPSGTLGAGAPREIWEWFVLAGLVILTIEWLLYAWRMRV